MAALRMDSIKIVLTYPTMYTQTEEFVLSTNLYGPTIFCQNLEQYSGG